MNRTGRVLIILMYSAEDMLAILFPHLFEDLEFLVPPEHGVTMDDAVVADVSEGMSQMQMNAEAGPSRLM
jgi:E3 ubiquitin-protein ligase SHPRH